MSIEELGPKLIELAEQTGKGFFFVVKHQPNKKLTPVRVELRRSVPGVNEPRESLSTLIGFEETVAEEESIYDAALKVKAKASRVEEFTGVYG